jgi:hypothetical protein
MKNASRFHKNQETVESRKGRKLFIPENYFFSTKAEGREETLQDYCSSGVLAMAISRCTWDCAKIRVKADTECATR